MERENGVGVILESYLLSKETVNLSLVAVAADPNRSTAKSFFEIFVVFSCMDMVTEVIFIVNNYGHILFHIYLDLSLGIDIRNESI